MRSDLAGNFIKRTRPVRMFVEPSAVYLYPKTVDFRRQFNGLALIVEQELDIVRIKKAFGLLPAIFLFAFESETEFQNPQHR